MTVQTVVIVKVENCEPNTVETVHNEHYCLVQIESHEFAHLVQASAATNHYTYTVQTP